MVSDATAGLSSPFAYPPTAGLFFIVLGTMRFEVSRIVFAPLNVASIVIVSMVMVWAARRDDPAMRGRHALLAVGMSVAVCVANPYVWHNVWMGQTSLLATACCAGRGGRRKRGATRLRAC